MSERAVVFVDDDDPSMRRSLEALASERPAREQAAPKDSRSKKARPTVRPFEIESVPTVSAVPRPASGFASSQLPHLRRDMALVAHQYDKSA